MGTIEIIRNAYNNRARNLTEFESKQVLKRYHIPITQEVIVNQIDELDSAVKQIGFPLVLKGGAADLVHKTEAGLVKIDLRNLEEARSAFLDIQSKMIGDEKPVLVQELVKGQRELVVGMIRDPQFGPCVMFGLGGIFTEVLKDVAFRVAPLEKRDAMDIMENIRGKKILDAVRGLEPVDREVLARILISVGQIGLENEEVEEIDINPLKIRNGQPIAVDALVVIKEPG